VKENIVIEFSVLKEPEVAPLQSLIIWKFIMEYLNNENNKLFVVCLQKFSSLVYQLGLFNLLFFFFIYKVEKIVNLKFFELDFLLCTILELPSRFLGPWIPLILISNPNLTQPPSLSLTLPFLLFRRT
jgi:hypothetical protein